VQLVACPSCHTQYDVTEVSAERFSCRCGAEIENRVPEAAADAKVHRCGSCGAIVQDDAEDCAYCGSAIVRDPGRLSLICPECFARCAEDALFCTACGVAFRPEEVRLEGHELPCPLCDLLMPPHHVGGIGVNECTSCRGLWVPGESFDSLVARAIEARRSATPEAQLDRKLRVTGANPAQQSVQYRKCPECQAFMLRRNYRKSSGVIIDVCKTHGTWLDADELEQIAGFILSGGETSKTIVSEERSADLEFKRLSVERRLERARGGTITMHHHGERSAAGSLLQILADLLS
jgi:Zn-finger nucleic acid-binding protein/predicted RNA-binding Zn-ribbon protein involved in translation (DUF1610 family)